MSVEEGHVVPENANTECVGPESDRAGKSSGCSGCPNQSACASGAMKEQISAAKDEAEEVKERMAFVKHKILVLSGKGGVGKSSVSSQLSWTLSEQGFQVGLLDIDICGPSAPRMLGVESEEVHKSNAGWSPVYASDNLGVMSVGFMLGSKNDAIIWRGPRKNGLIKQFLTDVYWGELDFLIVDAPPGTSDEHISIAQYLKNCHPDGAIIVTTPQEIALLDVRKEITFCRKVGLPILGVVENMSGFVCPCCQVKTDIFGSGQGKVQEMCKEMDVQYMGSLPLDPDLLKCCEEGKSYTSTFPKHAGTEAFLKFVETTVQMVSKNEDE
jgi:Mrp family chromosome partitioning ATPase